MVHDPWKVLEVLLYCRLRKKRKGIELIKKPKWPVVLPQTSVTLPEDDAELRWDIA